jgi:ribosomal protein S18 acetylase RimI-like enzyme
MMNFPQNMTENVAGKNPWAGLWGAFEGKNNQSRLLSILLTQALPDGFEVLAAMTLPDYRQQGLLKRILSYICTPPRTSADSTHSNRVISANDLSKKIIWLEVHDSNSAALSAYTRLGFKKAGMRPNYYPDGGAAILMTRALFI